MAEWKRVRLGDVADLMSGFPFDGHAYSSEGIRVVRGENVTKDSLRWNADKRWPFDLPKRDLYSLEHGDIVVSMDGNVGKNRARILERELPLLLAQRVARVRANSKADQRFIYFTISNPLFEAYMDTVKTGTTISHVSLEQIGDYPIPLPPLATQKRIAAVLGAIDDKIETNRKICANLEAQAQALFKSWFVDFEPFGGKMPKGWKMGVLGDLIEVCYGKDHKSLQDGSVPVFGSGGYMRSVDRCIYDKESVLIPRKGTLNNIMYVNEPFWTVDTMFYSKMREKHVAKYIHLLLLTKNMDELNVGSAVPSMTTEILNNMEVAIPSADTLKEFDEIATSFYSEVAHAKKESRALAAMRDALLPKLMSGEIDVEKVEVA